jgi:formate dehydrogenase
VQLELGDLLEELASLATEEPPGASEEWPFLLSAGERRSFTANTIMRDPGWRKKDTGGALRVHPDDAAQVGVDGGGAVRLTTKRASVVVDVELDEAMHRGHIALPNGLGLDHVEDGRRIPTGIAPNGLTASEDRDPWVGTPWHKSVPARLEAVTAS